MIHFFSRVIFYKRRDFYTQCIFPHDFSMWFVHLNGKFSSCFIYFQLFFFFHISFIFTRIHRLMIHFLNVIHFSTWFVFPHDSFFHVICAYMIQLLSHILFSTYFLHVIFTWLISAHVTFHSIHLPRDYFKLDSFIFTIYAFFYTNHSFFIAHNSFICAHFDFIHHIFTCNHILFTEGVSRVNFFEMHLRTWSQTCRKSVLSHDVSVRGMAALVTLLRMCESTPMCQRVESFVNESFTTCTNQICDSL